MTEQSRNIVELPKEVLHNIFEQADEHDSPLQGGHWDVSIFALMRVNKLFRDIVVDIISSQCKIINFRSQKDAIRFVVQVERRIVIEAALLQLYDDYDRLHRVRRHPADWLPVESPEDHEDEEKEPNDMFFSAPCNKCRDLDGVTVKMITSAIPLQLRMKYARGIRRYGVIDGEFREGFFHYHS